MVMQDRSIINFLITDEITKREITYYPDEKLAASQVSSATSSDAPESTITDSSTTLDQYLHQRLTFPLEFNQDLIAFITMHLNENHAVALATNIGENLASFQHTYTDEQFTSFRKIIYSFIHIPRLTAIT